MALSKACSPELGNSPADKDTMNIETYIDTSLTLAKRKRLNELLGELHSITAIDYTKQEILDIESAVHEMLLKICEQINTRGRFKVSRLQTCGSMAERASVWKHLKHGEYWIGLEDDDAYVEFDFLAILGKFVEEKTKDCPECAEVDNAKPDKCISAGVAISSDPSDLKQQFFKEVFASVDALFLCLSAQITYVYNGKIEEVSFKHNSSVCDGCIVRPTGILHLNTSIPILLHSESQTPSKCSLILEWRSNHGTLYTANLESTQARKAKNLPIFIDLLPAFESKTPHVSPFGYAFQTFLIPKYCNFCCSSPTVTYWKKSMCLSEIHTVANEMTDKHRKCYRIIKLLLELMDDTIWYYSYLNQYEVKTMVFHHTRTCMDSSDDCVDCVLRILCEVQHAYETQNLKSFHSDQKFDDISDTRVFERFIVKLCSVSTKDSLDTFVRKIAARYSDEAIE